MFSRLPTLIQSLASITILTPRYFYTSTRAMSTPDLKGWVQDRLTVLYTAPDDSAFHSAFEGTFAEEGHTSVSVNGEDVSREKYKEDILGQRLAMTKADVKFDNMSVEGTTKATEGGIGQEVRALLSLSVGLVVLLFSFSLCSVSRA